MASYETTTRETVPGRHFGLPAWRSLPLAGRAGIMVGGSLLALFLFKRLLTNRRLQQEKEAADEVIARIAYNPARLTISEDEAKMKAQLLYGAMNATGTDEQLILSVLGSLRTQEDLLAVIKAFGAPLYGYTGTPGWWGRNVGSATPLNLINWLYRELSGVDLAKVVTIFKRLGVKF